MTRGLEALHFGRRAIHVAAGADLALEQELLALQLLLRELEGGLAVVHVRFRGGQLRAARAGLEVADAGLRGGDGRLVAGHREARLAEIEADEDVAGLDAIALLDQHLAHAAGDLG